MSSESQTFAEPATSNNKGMTDKRIGVPPELASVLARAVNRATLS
jgi:hypothetical protein